MYKEFDVAVIGGGPGGYIAAIRSSQLGFNTACIDAGKNKSGNAPSLGGTCLNVGCIPSKALLQSSENFFEINHGFKNHGIEVNNLSIDIKKMIERKDSIVSKLTGGINFLFKKNKVNSFHGIADIKGKENNGLWKIQIKSDTASNNEEILAKNIIIATGSSPRELPTIKIDNKNILDNVGALDLEKIYSKIGIVGSGVIGLELGSVWKRLGSEVSILEHSENFLTNTDKQISKELLKILTKEQNLNILLNVNITNIENSNNKVTVEFEQNKEKIKKTFDKLIVAIGRIPNTSTLSSIKDIGLKIDKKGFIEVDDDCKTNLPNIWAIGDVVRGPMLAHKAMEEGVAVAERIAGQKPEVNLNIIPSVIYTNPEIACIGKTEEELIASGIKYKKGNSLFSANGRALGLGNTNGMIKVLSDEKTDRILGIHMIGPMVSELISEGVLAMEFSASSEDIARTVHAHPTLSEVMHEACLAVDKRALHG